MRPSPLPPNEDGRLAALARLAILDTAPEQAFDDLTGLAAKLCDVPISLVSLIDRDRQWFKSRFGFDMTETPRDVAFCSHAILAAEVLVVNDTHEDVRFHDNPLVIGDVHARFYAGAPLRLSTGEALGTLCVIDRVPRRFSAEQCAMLAQLARQVTAQLELRVKLIELNAANAALQSSAAAALSAEREACFYADMVRNMRIGICGFRMDDPADPSSMCLVAANDAMSRYTGHPKEVLLGCKIAACFPDLADGEIPSICAEIALAGFSYRDLGIVFHEDDDASLLVFSVRAFSLPNQSVGLTFDDITERWRADERLHHNEQHLRAVVDNVVDGIITTDARGKVETLNPAAKRLFGYSEAEIIGHNLGDLVSEAHRAVCAQAISGCIEREQDSGPARLEVTGLRKDGGAFPVELAMKEMSGLGRRLLVSIIRDVTERNEVDRLKNEFVSTVSHELRTPLTSIRGALGLLEGGALGALPSEATDIVTIARSNTDRLIRLINDILDLEKIEAGKLVLRLEDVDAQRIVDLVLTGLKSMAELVHVELVGQTDWSGDIRGDEDRLVQVLTNLVSNAVKFSPEAGRVEVGIAMTADGWVRFSVRDFGQGISPEDQGKLFGKFQQLDGSDTRQKGGTGLGLAISKAIVKQHGGRIGVESELGAGSLFWFELPCSDKLPLPPEPAGPRDLVHSLEPEPRADRSRRADLMTASASTPRILVIDDDEGFRRLVATQLRTLGAVRIDAATGAGAIRLARATCPDLIILDVGMPVLDGFDVVEILRKERCRRTPVIVYSCRDLTPRDRSALSLGVTRYLTKAKATEVEFLATVRDLLGLRAALPRDAVALQG